MDEQAKQEIAFFGKITAGVTHEMKNILAIIGESTGLMQDLLALDNSATALCDRLNKALGTIDRQIERGVELSNRLNRFAHGPDSGICNVDTAEAGEQVSALCQRFARLKKVTLDRVPSPSNQAPALWIDPVELQMVLFFAIDCCLSLAPADSRIRFCCENKSGCTFVLAVEDGSQRPSDFTDLLTALPSWHRLEAMAARLNAGIEPGRQFCGLSLVFPQAPGRPAECSKDQGPKGA